MKWIAGLLVACCAGAAFAGTVYVDAASGNDAWSGLCPTWDGLQCGPKATIQAGVDAAADGDEVVVSPGTYFELVDCGTKNIVLRSLDPNDLRVRQTTIVDGSGVGPVIALGAGSLTGFTVQNGRAGPSDHGAGVTAFGTAVVAQNIIQNNQSLAGDGGGVYATDAAVISGNDISSNSAVDFGGGVSVDGDARVTGNVIANNYGNPGGGIYAAGSAVVDMNVLEANGSDATGGGVYAAGAAAVRSNLIAGNTAFTVGGGVNAAGSAWVSNNTITNNTASVGFAGGARIGGAVVLVNNIVAFNRAQQGTGGLWGVGARSDYNCVYGNTTPNGDPDYGGGAMLGMADLPYDPRLKDDGEHLADDSPCINVGEPQAFGVGEFDIDGEPRVQAGRIDIGADERIGRAFVFGDMNCDGVRDAADIMWYFSALSDPAAYRLELPTCDFDNADINGDGVVDGADIEPFFMLL